MRRRNFLKKGAFSVSFTALSPFVFSNDIMRQNKVFPDSDKLLNAYYFRAHMYTCVPRQIREDMKWMADKGTQVVSVGVLEQDLWAAVENVEIICNEADKAGMKVYAVPSRWGGLVAGAPKVPSLFTIKNQQTWMKNKDGSYKESGVSGRISSIHYPETYDFVCQSIDKMMELWPIKGIIWDEPKTISEDFSDMALKNLGEDASYEEHVKANADFYSKVNSHIKNNYSNVETNMFLYANLYQGAIDILSEIKNLDAFGCDGRPWREDDGGKDESTGKVLIGNGERFIEAAHKQNKKALWLVENHNMLDKDADLMDKRMPEVLSKDVEHLIYYYYPRNLETPDMIMNKMAKHIVKYHK